MDSEESKLPAVRSIAWLGDGVAAIMAWKKSLIDARYE